MTKIEKVLYLFISIVLIFLLIFINYHKEKNEIFIDELLNQKSYAHLPVSVKNYIKDVYYSSGEVVLTEDNKEEGKPYLNPDYVDYLASESKEQYELIPDEFVYDFVNIKNGTSSNLPVKYDLRNVNGKSYVTPVKNQRSLGLCWDFSGIAAIESYLLKAGISSSSNPLVFNERTIDYIRAKAVNNIPYNQEEPVQVYTEGFNPFKQNGGSYLGSGGGPAFVYDYASYGFGLQPMQGIWSEYFTNHPTLNISQVFNYKTYAVTDSISFPILSTSETEENRQAFYNMIKQHLYDYGAVSLSTITPDGRSYSCFVDGSNTNDGIPLINNNEDCHSRAPEGKRITGGGHAMAIVGWNDSYRQNYCGLYNSGTTRTDLSEQECTSQGGTYHTIKGAWVIRNSWGEDYGDSGYLNMAYESNSYITYGIKRVIERDFDKFYAFNRPTVEGNRALLTYNRGVNSELLKRIVFKVGSSSIVQNGYSFDLYLQQSGGQEMLLKHFDIYNPGLYSVDVSNYLLNKDSFSLIFKNYGSSLINITDVTAFVSNKNDSTQKSIGWDASLDYSSNNTKTMLSINLTSNNISSSETINFELKNKNGVDVSNKFTDFVAHPVLSFFKKNFEVDEVLTPGEYTLTAKLSNGTVLGTINLLLGVPINECNVFVFNNKEYTGDDSNTKIELYDGVDKLILNTDYTISELNSNAGTHKVTITGKGKYKGSVEGQYTIREKKLNVKVKNKTITYGQTLNLSLSASNLTFTGLIGSQTPKASGLLKTNYTSSSGVGTYNLDIDTITLVNNGTFIASNYIVDEITKGSLIVNKAPLEYTIPTNIQASLNDTLSNVVLPQGFSWMSPSTVVSSSGYYKARAFHPTDPNNYETVENINIYVTVVESPQQITEIRIKSNTTKVYEGILPSFSATTTTSGITIRPYGSYTKWVYWQDGSTSWRTFSGQATAVSDGSTRYGLRLALETNSVIASNVKIYFNNTNITNSGHTMINTNYSWGGYLFIDLGKAIKVEEDNQTPTLTITNKDDTITLKWGDTPIEKVSIYRSLNNKSWEKIDTVTTNSFKDKKLTYGKKYYYKVKYYLNGKWSDYSNIVNKKITPRKMNLNIKSTGTNKIKLEWDTVNVTGYIIYISTDNNNWKSVKTITNKSTLAYSVTKLKANKKYYFKARAYKKVGSSKIYGSYSEVVSTKTAPSKPTFTIKANNYESLKLSITPPKGASKYIIYRSTKKDGTYSKIIETSEVTYIDFGLTTNKTYYYKIKACNTNNKCSGYSSIVSKKVTLKKPKISLETGRTIPMTIITTGIASTEGYEIYRSTNNNEFKRIATLESSETIYEDFSAKTNKKYYYKVRSFITVNGKKEYSPYSNVDSLKCLFEQ